MLCAPIYRLTSRAESVSAWIAAVLLTLEEVMDDTHAPAYEAEGPVEFVIDAILGMVASRVMPRCC
jgi:hypothetical protein